MSIRTLTHAKLVDFHREIAQAHKQINGFYRFNWNEINGQLRRGIQTPALLLESYSAEIEENQTATTHFNRKAMSFLLIDFTGKVDNYDRQEEVLDALENVALDIVAYLKHQNKTRTSLLFGMIEQGSITYEKVGPIFDNMYGWNVLYNLKNHEPMYYDPTKWEWPDNASS